MLEHSPSMDGFFLAALAAYLIGSIPFGLLLTRMAGLGDIRSIGSGNIGATNVLRAGSKKLALATLLLDFGKAYAAISLLPYTNVVATCVIVGHVFPVWLGFKGGKGVACFFGLTFALSWIIGLFISAGWLLVFFTSRYSSLAALLGIPLGILASVLCGYMYIWVLTIPIMLMLLTHYENVFRLLKGEEGRFSFRKGVNHSGGAE